MRGEYAYGICPHEAVLVAGINFNDNGSITAASLQLIATSISYCK
jgi:hypothetical protein